MNDNQSAFNVEEYDEKIIQTLPYYQDFYQQVVDIVKVYFKDKPCWLDVGCGTGKMAETALESLEVESFVLCDSSPKMIELVKKRFKAPNMTFLINSVEQLSFEQEFDIISAIQVIHYLHRNDRSAAIKKCYQALKPEGIFITFENFAPFSNEGKDLGLARWKEFQCDHGRSIDEVQKHLERYNQNYFPITISENIEIMKNCGFKAVELIWLSYMQAGFLAIK